MSALIPFLTLDQTCEQVQAWVNEKLTGAGFRVVQTFDLQVARLAHSDCPCPNHGTANCNCQMIVLLIYQKKEHPVTLVIHGQDDRTWLSLVSPAGGRANPHAEAAIRRALRQQFPNMLAPVEAAYEESRSAP
ncbi:MAG: hypothetical protein Q8L41_13230 [Anaerolineales bacterium]|nr:hypothetical protein [Anaerolineales bacterium]